MNINADLIRFNGEIGPQYYDEEARVMRPLTKDILKKIIVEELQEFVDVRVTGSYAVLSTESKPQGQQNETLLEYNEATGETKVYKWISGDWRDL